MDSQVTLDGRIQNLVDDAWRKDQLPDEDIAVPIAELPDPEADNGTSGETMREQENKWTDLGLSQFGEGNQNTTN